ncbi:DGQHR domain-containing protein [Photobacterium damselae]|uniref:DGQHR domain-containing protein n=1 Tax=Photobacterium damselae TaxID=38293 RepID=UPI002542D079
MANIKNEIKKNVIKLSQPLSDYFVFSIKARELLKICEPIRLEDGEEVDDYGVLNVPFSKVSTGTQRKENSKQVSEIKEYIISGDAAFPNTIILGANLDDKGFLLDEEDKNRWTVSHNVLNVPAGSFKASIIDGQHRVLGFKKLLNEDENNEFLNMDLLCTLYLDLPLTYHAQIFTHLNSTPRRVDRNLIYQLYQIDMDEKKPECWSPEVLAVYLARSLDSDCDSPLKDRLKLSVKERELQDGWRYTFSSVVEGILSLLSSNPKKDKNTLSSETKKLSNGKREYVFSKRSVLGGYKDIAPLRNLYLEQKDSSIYKYLLRYIIVMDRELISKGDSVFRKSIGFSACFSALRDILLNTQHDRDEVVDVIERSLSKINFEYLPDIPSTKVQGILKNVIILLVKDELRIDKKAININIKDRVIYENIIINC